MNPEYKLYTYHQQTKHLSDCEFLTNLESESMQHIKEMQLPKSQGIRYFKNDHHQTIYKVYADHYSSIGVIKGDKIELVKINEPFVFSTYDVIATESEWNEALDKLRINQTEE